jgi:hypothetical protein
MPQNGKMTPNKDKNPVSRRAFVTGAATSAALLLTTPYQKAFARMPAADFGRIAGYVTDTQRRHATMDGLQWKALSSSSTIGDFVVVDVAERYQKILGFGAAFTDAACFVFSGMEPGARQRLFADFFLPSR